ncbi:MAG: glycosyltransferase family 2 protein [Patescibacteria group bacterium]|jgi:GT2 family glycosyltransferase
MTDLSIIILNYNTKELILKCLDSIRYSDLMGYKVEVIVVDNASTDGSQEAITHYFKQHEDKFSGRLIKNLTNIGFAAGNNKGIRAAKGRYILVLNSDVILESDTLFKQIKFMENHKEFGVSTCRIVLKNGRLDPACHRGFPTLWASLTYFLKLEKIFGKTKLFGQYHQGWKDLKKIHSVDAISGAFFFARSEVFKTVGLFDEGFFMYAEDIDLCLRCKKAGFKIGFNPQTQILHLKGASGRKKHKGNTKANYYFWDTMKLFYDKHYNTMYPKPLRWLIFKILDFKRGELPESL